MKFVLTSILDKKGKIYSFPEAKRNPATATRDFQEICQNKQLGINKNPRDFCMVILAEFDNETGFIHVLPEIKILAEAENFVIQGETNEQKKN